jgi:hypothetical protein
VASARRRALRAESRTLRLTTCPADSPPQPSPASGAKDTRPRDGLSPNRPHCGGCTSAGDWDVWGEVWLTLNAATTTTIFRASIHSVSAAHPSVPADDTARQVAVPGSTAGTTEILHTGVARISLGTTTYYLNTSLAFAVSTAAAYASCEPGEEDRGTGTPPMSRAGRADRQHPIFLLRYKAAETHGKCGVGSRPRQHVAVREAGWANTTSCKDCQ